MLRIMSHPIEIMKLLVGSDMDFSLEEKKVGTWIDGKPIYSKTFADLSMTTTKYWINLVDISDLNIDNIVHSFGQSKFTNDNGSNAWYPLGSHGAGANIGAIVVTKSIIQGYLDWLSGTCTFTVTLWYTKTTD